MSVRAKLYKETLREIQLLNNKNEREFKLNKEKIYKKYPKLEEIESELGLVGVQTMKLVAFGGANREDCILSLKNEQQKLIAERESIIAENKIPRNMLEIQYDCITCKDTGEHEGNKCYCFKNKLMDKLYNQSNIRNMVAKQNFKNFKFDYYSNIIDPNEGISPQDNMQIIYKKCLEFINNFKNNKGDNLILMGNTGLGKTYLCNCIAGELLKNNTSVLYLTANQMFLKLADQRFNNNKNNINISNGLDMDDLQEWDRELLEVELLIIDDLGTEVTNTFTASELFRILNDRQLDNLSTVISTNLDLDQLAALYSDRIVSRLLGDFEQLIFFGDDVRVLKNI